MATRKRVRLTDAGIARLRPQEREFTVWDSRVPGLGVRVRPKPGAGATSSYGLSGDARGASPSDRSRRGASRKSGTSAWR